MVINSLKIKGKIEKEPKVDGARVFLTLKTNLYNKENTESILYVELPLSQWENIKDVYLNTDVEINGQIQARKTKNGTPLTYVKATNANMLTEKKKKNNSKKKKKKEDIEVAESIENVNSKLEKKEAWYKSIDDSEFIMIDSSEIELIEKIHMYGNVPFNLVKGYDKPVAVRKMDNGKYALVVGMQSFFSARITNKPVKAYITELDHKEFVKAYCY